jgi:hypothetical protein
MNTLPRAVTAQIFPDVSAYLALRRHWSALMHSDRKHRLQAEHHLLYLALLGKDWRRAFTPITNPRKLDNGAYWNWALWRALPAIHNPAATIALLAPLDGLVTPTMLAQVRSLLPQPRLYTYGPADFAAGRFPFAAYCAPNAALPAAIDQDQAHV